MAATSSCSGTSAAAALKASVKPSLLGADMPSLAMVQIYRGGEVAIFDGKNG
jgi:hypothetical protein